MKTNSLRLSIICAVSALLFMLYACSKDTPTASNNGGTEAGNAFISGLLFDEQGRPAANALVKFIRVDYDPHVTGTPEASAFTLTDAEGRYSLDSLANGDYNLFSERSGTYALRDSVPVRKEYPLKVPNDTLKKPGSLSGIVRLLPGHDSRGVMVIALGTERWTVCSDFTGHFSIRNLPAGELVFRFLVNNPDYEILDTTFQVRAGKDDTLSDTIRLRNTGLPVVQGLTATFDTLTGTVSLHWNSLVHPEVARYVLFACEASSPLPVLQKTLTDTFCQDLPNVNLGAQYSYVYRLKTQNANADLSPAFSAPETVQILSPTFVTTTVEITTRTPYPGFPTTTNIKDTIRWIAHYNNPTRPNQTIEWFDSATGLTVRQASCNLALDGYDTLTIVTSTPGQKTMYARVTDQAGTIWRSPSVKVFTILDAPISTALPKDTIARIGGEVLLRGTGRDGFGRIVEYAWDIGAKGTFMVSLDGQYRFSDTGDTLTHYPCVLRVRDDDGLSAYDTLYLNVWPNAGFVFWYNAKAQRLNLQNCLPGPCLSFGTTIHEGMIASCRQIGWTYESSIFQLGNGPGDSLGCNSFFWVKDLMNFTGIVSNAILCMELMAGPSPLDSINDEANRLRWSPGPIHIRCGVADFSATLNYYGGSNTPANVVWQDTGNNMNPAMGFNTPNSSLMAEETLYVRVPDTVTPGQFISFDVTRQINWILAHNGNQKIGTTGAYAIMFLVQRSQGDIGLLSGFSHETGTISPWAPQNGQWTKDGNTLHLRVLGNLTPSP